MDTQQSRQPTAVNLREIEQHAENEKFKWWLMFGLTFGTLSYLIYDSTMEAYPDMIKMTIGVQVITLAVSAFNHANADEPNERVRKFGIWCFVIVAALECATLWGHVGLRRDLSVAVAAKKEKHEEDDREDTRYRNKAAVEAQLAESQAALLKAQAEADRAERQKIATLGPEARLAYINGKKASGAKLVPPQAQTTPQPVATVETATAKTKTEPPAEPQFKSEAEARLGWRGYLSFVLLLQTCATMGLSAVMMAIKRRDSNRNGVPDWIEDVYKWNQPYVLSRWPHYFNILKGIEMQSQQPKNA